MTQPSSTVGTRCDELYRKVRITAGARFNAYRRLIWHDQVTQWSVALASVALIVVPLLEVLGATTGIASQWLTALQVVLAIVVLVFSLLLSRNNHAVRADRMHRCGLELKRLLRHLETFRGRDVPDATYAEFNQRYDDILNQHENHAPADYERYLLYCRDEYYPGRRFGLVIPWFKAHLSLATEFVPYLALLVVMAGAFLLMTQTR